MDNRRVIVNEIRLDSIDTRSLDISSYQREANGHSLALIYAEADWLPFLTLAEASSTILEPGSSTVSTPA